MGETPVCDEDDLADGRVRIVRMGDIEIGLVLRSGALHAYQNVCPHQGGPACEGVMMPAVREVIDAQGRHRGQEFDDSEMHLVCPWHGYEFRLSDGAHAVDRTLRLRKFDAFARDGRVYVRV